MLTAEKVIKEIYLLPITEREKLARYIIEFGIKGAHPEAPEILDIKAWQDEIARKPFNLKQAAEYLGVSSVTLRRWVKAGRVLAHKIGRAYTFDVRYLKELKETHVTKGRAVELGLQYSSGEP
jgi:excisionase family DNA binding protein